MSGYLVKNQRGDYFYVDDASIYKQEDVIEIPEGAKLLTSDNISQLTFWDGDRSYNIHLDRAWGFPCNGRLNFKQYCEFGYTVLWYRKEEAKLKEYLDKEKGYTLVNDSAKRTTDWIEVPEGANFFVDNGDGGIFFKAMNSHDTWSINRGDKEWKHGAVEMSEYMDAFGECKIVWRREDESIVDAELDEDELIMDKAKVPQHIIDSVTQSLSKVDETLSERQSQYGCFEDVAFVTENIISIMKRCGYDNMPHPHRMAMYMIVSKMARLVNGDCNHLDSWHDIGGYAKLIENLIGGENE